MEPDQKSLSLAGLAADGAFEAAFAPTSRRAGEATRTAAFAVGRLAEARGVDPADRAAAASALAPAAAGDVIVVDPLSFTPETAAAALAAWAPGPDDLADPALAAGAKTLQARARGEVEGVDARGRAVSRAVAPERPSMIPLFALDGLGPIDRRRVALGARAARELAARAVAERRVDLEAERARVPVGRRLDLTLEIDRLATVAQRIAATAAPTAELVAATAGPAAEAVRAAAMGDLENLDPAYVAARAAAIDALRAARTALEAVEAAAGAVRGRRSEHDSAVSALELTSVARLPPAPWVPASGGPYLITPGPHVQKALREALALFT